MISGLHTIIYSEDAEATRAFLRDVLGFPFIDAHDGWVIFRLPPAEVGIHPTLSDDGDTRWATPPHHQLSFMRDDLETTVADLRAQGVEVSGDVVEEPWGRVTTFQIPAAGEVMLYEPRHAPAHSLPD